MRNIISNSRELLLAIQQREIERTGITSLKIGFNNVFGYFLEVTAKWKDQVPPDWIRKQTIANGERFITDELKVLEGKILGAEEKILEEFSINAATWNLLQATDGTWEFTLKVTTDKALKRSKERESLFNNLPYFEATAILTAEEAFVAQGKIITQKVLNLESIF